MAPKLANDTGDVALSQNPTQVNQRNSGQTPLTGAGAAYQAANVTPWVTNDQNSMFAQWAAAQGFSSTQAAVQAIQQTPTGSPLQQAATQEEQQANEYVNSIAYAPGTMESVIGDLALAGTLAATGGAAAGAIAAPLAAAIGGTGGTIVGGAAAGAANGAFGAALQGQSIGTGALTGAVGGGLSAAAAPVTGALTNAGLPSAVASGIVKGGIGAATGALNADLNGTNIGQGALTGGVSGALKGAVGSATGSSTLGNIAGTVAKSLVTPTSSGSSSSSNGTSSNGSPSMSTGLTSLNPVVAGAAGYGLSSLLGSSSGSTTQGSNVGNLDTSLSGTIGSVLPGIAQAATGAVGTQVASNDMVNAENNAITTQQNNLGNINNIWSTQQQLGQGADTALGSALGTNGQPANYSNFENMPGYQFAVDQGTQAIQRQAAAMGSAYTPNTAAAVGQYVTGTASQDYNTYISQLMDAAGLGTTANQGLQTANQTTANNVSQLQQNIGQAQAYGATGVANSVGSLFGTNGAGTSLLNALTGSGANNSGAVGSALGNIGGSAASGAINGSSTLTGGNSTNPTGLGGSIAQAPAGNNIQYDSNGNIIGYTPNDTLSGGVNSSGVPNDLSNVYSSNYSNTVNNDGSGLFSGGNPLGGNY